MSNLYMYEKELEELLEKQSKGQEQLTQKRAKLESMRADLITMGEAALGKQKLPATLKAQREEAVALAFEIETIEQALESLGQKIPKAERMLDLHRQAEGLVNQTTATKDALQFPALRLQQATDALQSLLQPGGMQDYDTILAQHGLPGAFNDLCAAPELADLCMEKFLLGEVAPAGKEEAAWRTAHLASLHALADPLDDLLDALEAVVVLATQVLGYAIPDSPTDQTQDQAPAHSVPVPKHEVGGVKARVPLGIEVENNERAREARQRASNLPKEHSTIRFPQPIRGKDGRIKKDAKGRILGYTYDGNNGGINPAVERTLKAMEHAQARKAQAAAQAAPAPVQQQPSPAPAPVPEYAEEGE